MTTIPSTAVVVYNPDLVDSEHVALAGFLGGYRGLTRDAYALDLRQFVSFCDRRHLGLFEVRRSDIETFGREPGRRRTRQRPNLHRGRRHRLDRHGASRIVRRVARRAGLAKTIGPHTLRHAFITAALDAGVPLRDVQEAASHADPRTTMRYDRARVSLDRHATYIVSTYNAGAAR